MSQFDNRLRVLQLQIERKKHLENTLKELRYERIKLEKKLAPLKAAMEAEQEDVDRLAHLSFAAVFYTLLGKKAEKLEKEQLEAYAAAAKFKAADMELYAVQEDIERKETELQSLTDCTEQYEQVLREKEKAILAADILAAQEILQVQTRIAELENRKIEINAALEIVYRARDHANIALEHFEDAIACGNIDLAQIPLLGIGYGSTSDHLKYDHVSKAEVEAQKMRYELRLLRTELVDTNFDTSIAPVDDSLKFIDIMLDNPINDLLFLSEAQEAKKQLRNVLAKVVGIINKLRQMHYEAERDQARLETQRDQLVADAHF